MEVFSTTVFVWFFFKYKYTISAFYYFSFFSIIYVVIFVFTKWYFVLRKVATCSYKNTVTTPHVHLNKTKSEWHLPRYNYRKDPKRERNAIMSLEIPMHRKAILHRRHPPPTKYQQRRRRWRYITPKFEGAPLQGSGFVSRITRSARTTKLFPMWHISRGTSSCHRPNFRTAVFSWESQRRAVRLPGYHSPT